MSSCTFFFLSNTKVVRFLRQIPDDNRKSSSEYVLFLREKEEPVDLSGNKVLKDASVPKALR